jgi:uncharacterized RDD family membrane protein YckC
MKSIEFTTGQHVKIEYEIASTGVRVIASIIDLFAFFIYFLIFTFLIGASMVSWEPETGSFVFLLLIRIPFIFYSPIIEYLTRGQSLGKFAMGIRVVSLTGENAGFREYFTRWIFRVIDMWFGFGFLAILFSSTSERGQRLGDAMANTVVINRRNGQQYNLRNILAIKDQKNHEPTYLNVLRFTDDDVMLIKNTIQRVEKYPNEETKKFTIELAHKTAEIIGLPETPQKKMEFLKTVLLDYVVLTR